MVRTVRSAQATMRASFGGVHLLARRAGSLLRAAERSPDAVFAARAPLLILLAEDEAAMRSLLASELRRDGHRVIPCADGTELVKRIEAHRTDGMPLGIDLVIADVRMPGLGGIELLELLNEEGLGVPVILISAFGDIEMRNEARTRHAAAFLSKPFELDELRSAIRATVRRR